MGSRISVMKNGRIQQVGAPLEIYDRPANLFVAAFIGAPPMNFVAATVRDGGAALAASRFSLPVPGALLSTTSGRDGMKVVVGIRPEHISDPSEARGRTAKLTADIEIVEPLGDEVIVHARVGGDPLVYKTPPAVAPEAGQKREIAVKLDQLHLFDAATEQRLSP